MRTKLLTALLLAVLISGCSSGKGNETTTGKGPGGSEAPVVMRKKIEHLTPKTYVQVTIDLFKEQKKWTREFQDFMKKKRHNFYRSFGLTEKKYIDYLTKNQGTIRNYLKRNPHLNQQMNRLRSLYTQ